MKAETLRGNLEGMLLSVLEPGQLHGYAVIEELKRRSGDAINLPTGTVYPAL
ncbi:helix-turn-helix transcriptional regulator, partial [Streptomyces sp. NPDC004647]